MKILLALDGSEHALVAAEVVHSLPLPPGSEVTVLVVFPKDSALDQAVQPSTLERAKGILEREGAGLAWQEQHGHPAEQISHFADEQKPDLIVLGAHGLHASLGILLGGVAQQVVEHTRWPVLVVRAPARALRRVLLVTDGSPDSQQAASYLGQFPLLPSAEIQALHVLSSHLPSEVMAPNWPVGPRLVPPLPTSEALAANLAQRSEALEREGHAIVNEAVQGLKAAGLEPSSRLVRGDAAAEIIQYAKTNNVDLIVAGSRGLSAVKGWLLGSVSRKLVHYASCSVLVVREAGNSAA
jgi:nucleotide-binding universal stress UspA family protein